jgi:phosphoribosyl 1,2-cyclic phosphodiesterase
MEIRFWGTRGSIAAPGPSTVRYGGNTSCVEMRTAGGTLLVFDAGTGARPLGRRLIDDAHGGAVSGSLLLGHTHWDHIQGLPFFEPLFGKGHWDIYGPRGLGGTLSSTLAGQMSYEYFPVALHQLGAGVEFHELVEGTFEVGDVSVRTQYLNHPALALGYRLESDGGVVCYIADHEPFDPALGGGGDVMANPNDARHVEFLVGADIVVHDAQYDMSEYGQRTGWGHSTVDYVVDVCCAAGVARTVLFHHDPFHDDDTVDALVAHANRRAAGRTTVIGAAEGATLDVASPSAHRTGGANRPATVQPALEDLDPSVVLVTSDAALRAAVKEAAGAEGLPLLDVGATNALTVSDRHVIVVADVDDDPEQLDQVRSTLPPRTRDRLGILAVTRTLGMDRYFPTGVTEWLVWPASVAHVRTKLKAAVLRQACRWLAAPLARDEDDRLRALYDLHLLDTDPEPRFDQFTREACERFGVPIALITLVDHDRQWFKSRVGVDLSESPRDQSFCAHAILGPDVMQIPDTAHDPRFADNPAVIGSLRIRFYAGAPLTLGDGSRVGTICIADHRPRLLADADLDDLRQLARAVTGTLETDAS